MEFLAHHLEQDVSIDDLAAVACLSPFHFIRMFRNRMGMPPHRYLSQMRLDLAKSLLTASEVPLCEISQRCCFSSQSNFTRAFRRAIGMTPDAFRRSFSGVGRRGISDTGF
jgi:AraC family transcriptional regulator